MTGSHEQYQAEPVKAETLVRGPGIILGYLDQFLHLDLNCGQSFKHASIVNLKQSFSLLGGLRSKEVAYLLLTPGSNHSIPEKITEEKIIDVDEVNQWRWLEESGQWL